MPCSSPSFVRFDDFARARGQGQIVSFVLVKIKSGESPAIAELADGTLIIAATDKGLLRSEDRGQTWMPSRSGIDIGTIFTVKASAAGDRLYTGTDHGVYFSTDSGKSWKPTALDDVWAIGIGVDPADPRHLLVVNTNGELFASHDAGQTWD